MKQGARISKVLCLAILLGFAGLATARAEDIAVVRALSLLKAGEKARAYKILESRYRPTEEIQDKARIALVLALAEQRYLQKRRHIYAEFALRNYRNLESSMAIRLTRVVGDGRFDIADLDGAKRSFQFILASPTSNQSEKEYATYKLGWIYLNEKSPERAFRLWQNWLEQDIAGDLRAPLLRDAGRAWTEASLDGKAPSLRLKLEEGQGRREFFAGLIEGAEAGKKSSIYSILSALSSSSIFSSFFSYVLENHAEELAEHPCESLEFLNRMEADAARADSVQILIERCQKRIDGGLEANIARKKLLLGTLFSKYPVSGSMRSVKAASMLSLGQVARACIEYADSSVEVIRSGRNLDRLSDLLRNVRQSCKSAQGVSEQKVLRELVEVFLSSGLVAKGIKDKKAIVLREFAGMIQDNSGLREVALRQAGKSHELWSNGPLPEVLILNTKFELAQQLAFLHAFLKDGYKSNLASGFAGVVVELLRARRITDAEELLRRNLALEAPRSFSEIVLWAKFLEQKGADYELYRALLKAALKADDRTRVAGAERREAINRLLQLALQEKYYSAIADRQPFFAKALLNNLSGLDVYIEALVFSPEMEEALDLAARDSVLNYAAAARALVAGKSNANDRKLIQETKGILAKTKVHQDILELERLNRAFSAVGRLKGTNMVSAGTVLLPLIQVADNAIDNAKRHAWTSLQAREAAKAASRAYAQNMAQILDALPLGTKIGTRNPKDLSARVRKKVLE